MATAFTRHASPVRALAVIALLTLPTANQDAHAQNATDLSADVVQIPASQLSDIQAELRYLRARDAERQVWQDSVMSRLPSPAVDFVSHRNSSANIGVSTCQTCDTLATPGCSSQCTGSCGHCTCECYPCQCPLTPAPCIDCPRVSTLSPYFNINFFGALKLDMLFNTSRPLSPGVPFFLTPDSVRGLDQNTLSIHARQSTLGAAFTGPQFGGFQSGGQVIALFFNDNVIADQYGLLPLQAWGDLKNEDWRFAAGLQFDVFSPGLPTVLPFSALAGTGNAGNSFRGQLRLERYLYPADDAQLTLQVALSEPITSTIDPNFRLSEDNGWPNVEGRIALGLGPVTNVGLTPMRPIEIGISGVVGQIRTTPAPPDERVVADVWGLSSDFRWAFSPSFGVAGEVFTGQTLGTYNGGILQNVNAETLNGIRSSGGWLEAYVYLTPCLHSHNGMGIDDPIDRDVGTLGRVRNSVYYSNLLWDLNSTFRIGFEFTWRETNYKSLLDDQGAGFHTQFQWAF